MAFFCDKNLSVTKITTIFADGKTQIELWQDNIIYGHFSKHQHVPQLKEEKMKKISICNRFITIWLVFTILLFLFLIYNYVNSLDIIKYRVDVYSSEDSVKFDLNDIKNAVNSFKELSIISISYVGLTGAILWMLQTGLKRRLRSDSDNLE